MARKRRFHRTAPDRGWIVGNFTGSLSMSDTQPVTTGVYNLFDFADIDPEALTGRIEQDKSDWFVKRVILNVWVSAQIDDISEAGIFRLAEWACGTIGNENALRLDTENIPLFGPEAYNLWARQFQSGVLPAYHPGITPLTVSNPSNTFAINADRNDTNQEAGWMVNSAFWGPAQKEYDFTVSNAGLRNNQTCVFALSIRDDMPVIYGWDPADVLRFGVYYQVLVQKRRGS